MRARTYVKTLLAGLSALLLATAAFNRIVDPFWHFRDTGISGFNRVKPEFARFERHIKPEIVRRQRPEALIFGNSFAEIGFDPTHPSFTDNGKLQGFNFAMAGADWNRVYCSVLHAIAHAALKRAVIGLPYWSLSGLPTPDCGPLLAEMEPVPLTTLLLSRDALRASWRTLRKQGRKLTHTAEGLYFYTRDRNTQREKFFAKELADEIGRLDTTGADCAQKVRKAVGDGLAELPQWQPPTQAPDLSGLRSLLEILTRNRVEVKLLVFPLHALPFEAHILCGNSLARWQALWQIAGLVDEMNRRTASKIELWDFQGTSGYLTETIRNEGTRFWQDTGHFNYEMGNTLLDTLFHARNGPLPGEQEPFGVVLSQESIPRRLTEFFRYRQAFLSAHPEFHRELAAWLDRIPGPASGVAEATPVPSSSASPQAGRPCAAGACP